jgi:acyl dehydratase
VALNLHYLLDLKFSPVETVLTDRDVMLYALSIGLGHDPESTHELSYVYEKNLKIFPTMPLVIGQPGSWMSDPGTGITRTMSVHGAQRLTTFAELPIGLPIVTRSRITDIVDKSEKGAMIILQRESRNKIDGMLLAHSESTIFCRADGGFGGHADSRREFQPLPDRRADMRMQVKTKPDAALLYRLNQDRNPLHADPTIARAAGFARPILHGLCTLGMVAVEITRALPGKTLRSIETRFTKPVLPGDEMTVELWSTGDTVSFRATCDAGRSCVLDKGNAGFA